MQVERSVWEQDVITAVTVRLRGSTALFASQGIELARVSREGVDPDTSLEVAIVHRGRRYQRRWRVWNELSGKVQPVPHPDLVAGEVLTGVLTMPSRPRQPMPDEAALSRSATPLPLIGRDGRPSSSR